MDDARRAPEAALPGGSLSPPVQGGEDSGRGPDAVTVRILLAAIAIAVSIAIMLGAGQREVLERFLNASRQLDRSQDVRVELAHLEASVKAARLAAGAYLRDPKQIFSSAFDSAYRRAADTITRLVELVDALPERSPRVQALATETAAYLRTLVDEMDLRDRDAEAGAFEVNGARRFEALLAHIGEFASAETETLATRRASLHERQRSTEAMLIGIDLVFFVLLIAVSAYALGARARARIGESRARNQYLFDLNPLPMFIFDRATLAFLEVNRAAIRIYGYSREEFRARTILDIRPPEDVAAVRTQALAEDDRTKRQDWRHVTRAGKLIHVRIFARDVVYEGRRARMVLAEDITEQRSTETLLRDREASLLDLARRLMRTQEDERRAIARELHDDLLQDIAAARLSLQIARAGSCDEQTRARLREVDAACGRLTAKLRTEALDLHPAILDDFGLVAAIDSVCERFRTVSDIAIDRTGDESMPRIDPTVEIAAYRIAQEAIANAVRHSGAARLNIDLRHRDGHLRISIGDDGNGIADPVDAQSHGKRLGLVSMRERAELIGGRFTIASTPTRGTTVVAEFMANAL